MLNFQKYHLYVLFIFPIICSQTIGTHIHLDYFYPYSLQLMYTDTHHFSLLMFFQRKESNFYKLMLESKIILNGEITAISKRGV